jgi:Zn-dependent protease with chaperone function
VSIPAVPPVVKPLPSRPVPVHPILDSAEIYNGMSDVFHQVTADKQLEETGSPEVVLSNEDEISRWVHLNNLPVPDEPVKPCVAMSVKNAPPVPDDVQRAISQFYYTEVTTEMKRCMSCGQFKGELHACPRTQDVNRKVQRERWMKRAAVAAGAAVYSSATMLANGVIPAAEFMVLLVAVAPLLLRNKNRFLLKEETEVPDLPSHMVSLYDTLDARANAIAKAIGISDADVKVNFHSYISGAQVERDGKKGIVIQLGERFVNDLTVDEQNGIIAHELGHMTKRGLRRLSNYMKAFSAPIGLVAGGVAASIAGGSTVITLGAPVAVGAAVALLVAGPIYLAGQAAARAEERRADKVAYDLYGEEYVNGMKTFMNHYRPGDNLPFALGDIGEPHPSLLNRIRALRGTE